MADVTKIPDASVDLKVNQGRLNITISMDMVAGLVWLTKQTEMKLDDMVVESARPFLKSVAVEKALINEKFTAE